MLSEKYKNNNNIAFQNNVVGCQHDIAYNAISELQYCPSPDQWPALESEKKIVIVFCLRSIQIHSARVTK